MNVFDYLICILYYVFYQEISVPMNRGKYNLYAYTEGQTMEKIKSKKFYGTPVIFIPGHSGSYRQGMDENSLIMLVINKLVLPN